MAFSKALALAASLAALAAAAQLDPQPEGPSGITAKKSASAKRYMVAAADPRAVDAGLRMLDRGGSAVDAMMATQLVLNLVEPQSSGLGGSAYLLHYDAKAKRMSALDGRETAPAAAGPDLLLRPDGKPIPFQEAIVGGRAVGVPGVPRLLEVAHARHGKLPWKDLFAPAIELAENGFAMSARVRVMIERDAEMARQPAARAYFFEPDGKLRATLRNPGFAGTLRLIASGGSDAFYHGEIARDIVATVRGHPTNPGVMTLEDLAAYRVRDIEAPCVPYRAHRVCAPGPSTYGGIGVMQMLGMLSRFDLPNMRPGSSESLHLFAEAGRLAYADRARFGADDRFVHVPAAGLLDPQYLRARSSLIRPGKSMARADAGTPPGMRVALADAPETEPAGTSHVSIVDAEGNALSMTTSIEWFFGSRQMVRGFFLNNQLSDFNATPVEDGRAVANGVAPGKRPRSSMAPVIVLDGDGRVEAVVGSAGGSFIINYVTKALVAMLDWGLDPQAALDLPNFGSRNGPTELEKGTELERLDGALKAMGHEVRAIDMISGTHAIRRTPAGWAGGADPRREGAARGR